MVAVFLLKKQNKMPLGFIAYDLTHAVSDYIKEFQF